MSAPTLSFDQMATPARATPQKAERVQDVADTRARQFFVTRRFDVTKLPVWQRTIYVWLCRRLQGRWRVPPPFIPLTRGGLLTFEAADDACETSDDQIHVLPLGWVYSGDEIDAEEVCRPRDPTDERYAILKAKYGCASPSFTSTVADLVSNLKVDELACALASLPSETRHEVNRLLMSLYELTGHDE